MIKKFLVFCVLVLGLATNTWAQVPANLDVGGPAAAGNVAYDPGTDSYTIQGAGNDVWGTWDQFHYVFRPLAGDGSGVVRIVSQDTPHEWSKVGVMIRETLDGNSKHACIAMTGTHGVQTVWREETGGGSQGAASDIALPIYVKIERIGDTINTYMTFNPAFWIPQQSLTIPMKANVYIGMFVCSHVGDTLATAVFDSVDLQAPPFLSAWAVQPADGLQVKDLSGLTISWMAGDTADSHNVHFGTESPPPLAVNQTETTYDTGALAGGTTYYYRIDEVEADGTTVHAGEERSFSTFREGTGSILREVWEGIGGVSVSDLTNNANYPANPSYSDERAILEAPIDFADNFGSRMHGWLVPETSGDYTFWISSDDASDLWLSTSDSPVDAARIAYVSGWTSSRQWDKEATQNSTNVVGAPIPLEAGQMYYISALYKEGGGGDNCAVAWEGPDSPTMSVIDGYYLMPFENLWAWGPDPADGATGVAMSPTLSWQPAVDAVSYDVYVDDALLASTADTSVEAGPFDLASSHTWRVDVVTNSPVRTGATWSFTVTDNRVIDDFEAYDSVPEGIAPQFAVGGDYTIEAVAPPEQTVIGGDVTIEAVAPPEQGIIGGDYTIEPVEPNAANLWAYYPLDEDANDASGNEHHGTAVGGTYVAGTVDQALQFTPDPGDDYVDLGTANPSEGTGQLTVSLWLNWNGISGQWQGLCGKRDTWGGGPSDMMWQIEAHVDSGNVTAARNGGPTVSGYGVPVVGEWEHLVFSTDGSTGTLYRNGEKAGSGAFTLGPDTEAVLQLGSCEAMGNNPFNGALDEVRIYSTAITEEGEIRWLAGLGDKYVPPIYGPLIAHYELETDASDSSGNGIDGTLVGDAVSFVDGKLQLGGDADYVDFGKPAQLPTGNVPWTLSGFAKADSASGGWHWIAAFGNNGTGQAMFIGRNADTLVGGGYGDDLFVPTFWKPDVWVHICLTYDGTTARMYADGIEIASAPKNWSLNIQRAYLGAQVNPGPNEWWDGQIDDVRIYNIALSPGEVAHLTGGDVVVPPVYGPCRLSLEFEGDLTDSSGNNNHGTAVGAVAFEADPDRGQVVSLPGGDNQFVEVGNVGLSGNDPTTIACWAKADHTSIPNWTLIFGFTGNNTRGGGGGSHFNIGSLGGPGGCGAHVWGWEETIFSDDEALEWHHYAMTYDGSVIRYFGDGEPKDTDTWKSNFRDLSARGDRVHVGSRVTQGSSFPGKVDDARVYDYVLSQAELLNVAGLPDKYVPTIYGPMALHMEFEGDATDSSGNGRDGTLMGDASIVDGELVLDGDGDYVNVDGYKGITAVDAVQKPFTIANWFKTTEDGEMVTWGRNAGRQRMTWRVHGGRLRTEHGSGNLRGNTYVNDDEWHHGAVVVNEGANLRVPNTVLYVDGKQDSTFSGSNNVYSLTPIADVCIGCRADNKSRFFNGSIDDVRIYDHALKGGQIAGLVGATADNPISDTWSDVGMIDFALDAGTMKVNTYALPGLPYYVGEVGRALPFADLTAGGGKALSMWLQGDPANIAGLMYMSVADADGQSADLIYDGDVTNPDWAEWNVDMRDLTGVDVSNAADIAIGLAGLDGGVVADLVTVDNIRVYTGRCMPDLLKPAADFNNDCVVNVDDLMILAGYWGYEPGAPGVWYEYYPEPPWIFGDDIQNAPFDTTTPTKQGVVNNFDIGIRDQDDRFGFRFIGMIEVPEDGDYTFYTSSDDGSFLDIDDTRVVENYGWHGMQWREGTIALTAGKHKITVAMFEDGGGEGLETEWAGPGIDRQAIPDDVLSLGPTEVDLSGDGTVGWMDVILMLGDWLDEELWPY